MVWRRYPVDDILHTAIQVHVKVVQVRELRSDVREQQRDQNFASETCGERNCGLHWKLCPTFIL